MTNSIDDGASNSPRIASLDVLRGIAILGILFMNIPYMGNTVEQWTDPRVIGWTPADQTAWFIKDVFLDGTQRGLLELLFGATAYIIASKSLAPRDPVSTADVYYRRTLWLMVFGILHGTLLLWPGDILFNYGLAGLALFPLRRLAPRRLILIGCIGLGLVGASSLPGYFEAGQLEARVAAIQAHPHTLSAEEKKSVEELQATRHPHAWSQENRAQERKQRLGGYPENLAFAWKWEKVFNASILLYLTEFEAFFTMLIGMGLFKSGVLQGARSGRFYLALAALGYGVGLSLRTWEVNTLVAQGFGEVPIAAVVADVGRLGVTFGHLGLIHLLLRTRLGETLLAPFKASGKMALTCYIGQSLICLWLLFPGFGLGLWGRFGLAQIWGVAAAVIAFELIACNLWLRVFSMGPLEWVWRRLSYGRAEQPQPVAVQAFA